MRGVAGAQRSNRYGTVPNYLQTINDNICVLLQIESRPGIEAVDEIASVEGVDGVFIGPSDLAAALGHLGHPEVQDAIRHLYQRVSAQGKAVGILAPVHADARRYLDMGMHFVAVGTGRVQAGRVRAARGLPDVALGPALGRGGAMPSAP